MIAKICIFNTLYIHLYTYMYMYVYWCVLNLYVCTCMLSKYIKSRYKTLMNVKLELNSTQVESSQIESNRIESGWHSEWQANCTKNFVNCIIWQSAKSIWEKFQIQTRTWNGRTNVRNERMNGQEQGYGITTNKQSVNIAINQVCFNHKYVHMYRCTYVFT